MKKNKKLIIVGVGETAQIAYEYFSLDSEYVVSGFAVEEEYLKENSLYGLPIISTEDMHLEFPPTKYSAFVAISSTKLNRLRTRIYNEIKNKGYQIASYISSRAFVWPSATIGENCFVFEDNTIQPFVKVGNNVVLWSGNHIGHNTIIQDNCFIASHVVISGFCDIGKSCFIGVNSTIINNITIGKDCFIGAAALIQKNLDDGGVYQSESTPESKVKSLKLFRIKE